MRSLLLSKLRNALIRPSGRVLFLCFSILVLPSYSQTYSSGSQTSDATSTESDEAAIRAMQLVVVNSGGTAAWSRVRSSKEVFNVSPADGSTARLGHFLDDWSTDITRYRRGTDGMHATPAEHNGDPTFTAKVDATKLVVPEFDQARTVVNRLPAAAAAIMLRNKKYIFKIATTRPCTSNSVCIDVFEGYIPGLQSAPEQCWTISSATGLPINIATAVLALGPRNVNRWRIVRFLAYAAQENVIVPSSLEVTGPVRGKENWTLVSFVANPEFDTAHFDKEVAR